MASVLTGFISFRETIRRGKERINLSWFIRIHSSTTCDWLFIQWDMEELHREPLCTRFSHQEP